MKRFGLIGSQISYSLSPKLHQLIASELNFDCTYELIDIKEEDLFHYIQKLKSGVFAGYNITIPYKETIIKYLDILTPAAKYIGAVNTVYFKDGQVVGDNTDYLGFDYILAKNNVLTRATSDVYILGSGGAAKACYFALKERKITPIIVSINEKEEFFPNVISYNEFREVNKIDLLINATPIGNINNPGAPIDKLNKEISTIIDLTYNPRQTKLMTYANNSFNGLEMLVIQAIEAQKRWANKKIIVREKSIERIKGELQNELIWKTI